MSESIAIPEVTPPEAAERLHAPDAVLLDVRSRVEYEFVGHPVGAVHVALKEFPDWNTDPDFVALAEEALNAATDGRAREVDLYVMCRSGARSLAAAQLLAAAGFPRVTNIAEGFEGDKDASGHRNTVNGWRAHGLAWEQT